MKPQIELDKPEVAEVVNTFVHVGSLWSSLNCPLVRLAFEQTVRRLGGQVKVYPEPEEVWDTDLELAIVRDLLIAKLPCGNAEVIVNLTMPHKLLALYDRYFYHEVPTPTSSFLQYDIIWDFTPYEECNIETTTVTATSFEYSLLTCVVNRNFQFVGRPWWDITVSNIVHFYERLILTRTCAPSSTTTVRFVLADVELPTREGDNVILFPRNVSAGYWVKQFAMAAAVLAATI
jgi:hypothetical protein